MTRTHRTMLFFSLLLALSFPSYAGIVNVEDCGAYGNDVNDDHGAIQDAIDTARGVVPPPCGNTAYNNLAGTGVVVYFPRGRYLINNTLTIGNGNRIILRGEGLAGAGSASVLRMNDPTKNMIDTTGLSDVLSVEHMCFWGAGARTGDAANLAVGNAFYIPRMTDGRFRNNWFVNIPKAGIYSPSTGPDANMGLNNTHFIDNTFDISGAGIRIDRAYNDIILGNRFYSVGIGVDLKWGERVQINSNHFDLVGRLADGSEAAIRVNGGATRYRSLQISSNVFSENGNDIKLDAGTGTIEQTTIVANNSKIVDRSFLILNGTNDTQVIGNHVRESSYLASNTYSAFVVSGSASATRISENSTASDRSAAKYGLEVDSTVQGTILGFNRFAGATGAVKVGNVLATQNPFGEPSTVVTETGYAGLRFWADQATRSGAYNVNFRTKRTTAPTVSQITINCPLIANASQVFVTSPTVNGFRFNITAAGPGDVYAVDCTYTVTN